jgi:signal recognition particle receptor subunit alpha
MDKVVFVGEALVGNQAVSQLEKFNEGLREFSTNKRQIDAIILSKVNL